jgi:hypothetical protein
MTYQNAQMILAELQGILSEIFPEALLLLWGGCILVGSVMGILRYRGLTAIPHLLSSLESTVRSNEAGTHREIAHRA